MQLTTSARTSRAFVFDLMKLTIRLGAGSLPMLGAPAEAQPTATAYTTTATQPELFPA